MLTIGVSGDSRWFHRKIKQFWLQLVRLSVPIIRVEVMSSGFENSKEWLNFLVSVLNLIATISIPFLLWWYSKQQEKQQERQAAQQRLKDHVGQLTAAGGAAQGVIVYFRDDCRCVVAASVAGASTASAHSTC